MSRPVSTIEQQKEFYMSIHQIIAGMSLSVLLLLGLSGCATVPYTGRSQFVLMSPQQELALGQQASQQVRREYRVNTNPRYTNQVERVGRNVARAANQPDYEWVFTTIEDSSLNAFALPGGKVYVNTGMVDFAKSDAELATVIAHEIAHVIARHGAERMSRVMMAQIGGSALAGALNIQTPATRQAFDSAYGLATNVGVILPHSRSQELEADRIGLILMAKAGYNPSAALDFWSRMMSAKEGSGTPSFLSTHPTDETRLREIRSLIPEAMKYYSP